MAVFVDTAAILAFLLPRDDKHGQAMEFMPGILDGERGLPVISDYILDEALTFIVNRGATRKQLDKAIAFLVGDGDDPGAFAFHSIESDHIAAALRLVRRHRERKLSFTDCTSLAMMESLGVRAIASFDAGFDGLVDRIHSA